MADLLEDLKQCFDDITLNPSAEVLNKCVDICTNNNITDASEFVETWLAYSVSNLGGGEPTVKILEDMEKKMIFSKNDKTTFAMDRPRPVGYIDSPRPPVPIGIGLDDGLEATIDGSVLGSYGCKTPKASRYTSRLTGLNATPNRSPLASILNSPGSPRSQDLDPSNFGNVVYTFGNGQRLKQINWTSIDADTRDQLSIQILRYESYNMKVNDMYAGPFMSDDYDYMFDSNYERILILGDQIFEGCKQICQKLSREQVVTSVASTEEKEEYKIEKEPDVTLVENVTIHHVDYPSKDLIKIMGRVVVESEQTNDRLAIVGCDEMTLRYMKLDFSKMNTWSIYPGEIAVLEGTNPKGHTFEVQKIHYERELTNTKVPMNLGRDLNMVIAAGPFSDADDLSYEKLSDLLAYCQSNCPDVLILTGPFGNPSNPLFSTIGDTFEEHFEKLIVNIMNSVSPQTEVLIVANHDDLTSMFVYPSFPYRIESTFHNLHFLPDPCVFSINGLEIGVTTVDIVKDLTDAEEGKPKGDKIKRAISYMFHTKTFYPLNPPPEHVPLDLELLNDCGNLLRIPHILICPGDLKCYIRDVQQCVCINPGRLCVPGDKKGTFARVMVKQPESEKELPFNHILSQVVKL